MVRRVPANPCFARRPRYVRRPCFANTLTTGANPPATTGQHALCKGAGEEDGHAVSRSRAAQVGPAEEPYQQDLDQYVLSLPFS